MRKNRRSVVPSKSIVGWTVKLSFFPDGSQDAPLLMLSDLSAQDIAVLRDAAVGLANGNRDSAVLHDGSGSELRLTLLVGERNVGIRMTPPSFRCVLRRTKWSNVEGLVEPFSQGGSDFQWLDDSGEVALLLSPLGVW